MRIQQQLAERGVEVERREYNDGVEIVADLGPGNSATVEVIGDTAIVVTEDDQYDVDVPADAQAFMKNGVLTIDLTDEVDA